MITHDKYRAIPKKGMQSKNHQQLIFVFLLEGNRFNHRRGSQHTSRRTTLSLQVVGRAGPANRLGGFNRLMPIPIEKAPSIWRRLWERLFIYKSTDFSMTDGINSNMSRSHANPLRTQDQQDDVDNRQTGDALGALHAVSNEMESLRLVNQRLLRELAELTRQVQRPQEAQQAREGPNNIPQEEQQHLGAPRDVDGGGENSQTREHDPYIPPEEGRMRGCLTGTTEVMSQPLISKGRGNNLGSSGSRTSNKSSAT